VDPLTVYPGVPGALTARAWGDWPVEGKPVSALAAEGN